MDYHKQEQTFIKYMLCTHLYQEKARECNRLELELKELKKKSRGMSEELKLYKSLAKYGAIYVNTYSQDCDGVERYSTHTFKTIEEHNQAENSFAESVEGSCSWKVVAPKDARPQEECGTYGQGWGIN